MKYKQELIGDLCAADGIGDVADRYAKQFLALDALAMERGLRLYNRDLVWLNDPEFWGLWKKFPEWRRHRPERKFMLWSLYRSVAHLGPCTAECGVYTGGSSFLICQEGERLGHLKKHFGFDSFEGLSEPTKIDMPTTEEAYLWAKGDLAVDEHHVRALLEPCRTAQLLKGWIPERFDEVGDAQFSFVHVDVDLYEPTLASIEFFYPRLVPGGILLCDDYGAETCPGARRALDEYCERFSLPPVVDLCSCQGMMTKAFV
ncbi:MAG: class I SAM-dependent methyltransferase [Phycisphaerales bacterium]|nr:class I SAM-dependent methyltransferase [Phycisphaerales bacterium]